MQNEFASLMQTLAPDLAAEMSQRALVLERIASMAPVGRRQLAAKLHLTEREIRACADKLREQGFISLDPAGMTLTDKAREILPGIQAFTRAMNDLSGLEEELAKALNALGALAHFHGADNALPALCSKALSVFLRHTRIRHNEHTAVEL